MPTYGSVKLAAYQDRNALRCLCTSFVLGHFGRWTRATRTYQLIPPDTPDSVPASLLDPGISPGQTAPHLVFIHFYLYNYISACSAIFSFYFCVKLIYIASIDLLFIINLQKSVHIDYIKKTEYFLIHTEIVKCKSIDYKSKRFYFPFVEQMLWDII